MADDIVQRIAANLARIEERITGACKRSGRCREAVTLIAVSKLRSLEETRAAFSCGIRHLGENRVEELQHKVPAMASCWAGEPPTWHMIGHVQSRKARYAVELCGMLHSLDSLTLAGKLESHAAARSVVLPVLIECNIAGEAAKYGYPVNDNSTWPNLAEELNKYAVFPHLSIQGLMTMAPMVTSAEETRPHFHKMRELRDYMRQAAPFSTWAELSMGMTDDFVVAIEEGATMIRIGRAIFNTEKAGVV